jgi:hypothetical protein
MADQQKHSANLKLCSIVSAERQGRTEFARVVLSPKPKKQWDVSIWSWGACDR